MNGVRLTWTGALEFPDRDRWRYVVSSALDRANSARVPFALDLAQVTSVDRYGLAAVIALGRTARFLQVPVRIEHASWQLRVDTEAANAYTLFEWWPSLDDE